MVRIAVEVLEGRQVHIRRGRADTANRFCQFIHVIGIYHRYRGRAVSPAFSVPYPEIGSGEACQVGFGLHQHRKPFGINFHESVRKVVVPLQVGDDRPRRTDRFGFGNRSGIFTAGDSERNRD